MNPTTPTLNLHKHSPLSLDLRPIWSNADSIAETVSCGHGPPGLFPERQQACGSESYMPPAWEQDWGEDSGLGLIWIKHFSSLRVERKKERGGEGDRNVSPILLHPGYLLQLSVPFRDL